MPDSLIAAENYDPVARKSWNDISFHQLPCPRNTSYSVETDSVNVYACGKYKLQRSILQIDQQPAKLGARSGRKSTFYDVVFRLSERRQRFWEGLGASLMIWQPIIIRCSPNRCERHFDLCLKKPKSLVVASTWKRK